MASPLAALLDTIVTASAGVLVALIGAGFTFAGVLINARSQTRPPGAVPVDVDRLAELRAEILDRDHRLERLEAERDYWRDEAMRWMPQRRRTDPPTEEND